MTKNLSTDDTSQKNKEHFANELKLFVNERLFEKNLISEEMYWTAKELLLKQSG